MKLRLAIGTFLVFLLSFSPAVPQGLRISLTRSSGGGTPNLFTTFTNGTPRNDVTDSLGAIFSVANGFSITVDALCRWKISGNSQSHTVYLVEYSPSFSNIASVSIDMSTGTAGTFTCVNLGTPQTLAGNQSYAILSAETNGGDQWYGDSTSYTGSFANTSGVASAIDAIPPVGPIFNSTGLFTFGPVNAIVH
jgi:hypothetical protein